MTVPARERGTDTAPVEHALQARITTMFAAALVAVSLLWLPLAVIPILDGMFFLAPALEVLRDLALLWWLGLVLAGGLAAASWTVARLVRVAGASAARAALVGWCVLLLPLTWACTWLGARMAWHWLRSVAGSEILVTQELRALAVVLLAGFLAWGISRWKPHNAVKRVAGALAPAWPAAAALLALGAIPVVLQPPHLLLGETPAAAPARTQAGPDIILITIDTLAAADADACNPASSNMPRLAGFAQGATCFSRFYAASNFTTPTTSTMETGLLPWTHFATQPDAKMRDGTRSHTLAAVLRTQGWRTHSITDNLLASPRHRGTFAAYTTSGFSHTTLYGNFFREAMTVFPDTSLPRLASTALSFLGSFDMALHGSQSPYVAERTYDDVLALMAREGRAAPLFVWAQTLPPHSPYLPPTSTRYRLLPKGELEAWADMMPDNVFYKSAAQGQVDKHRLRYRELTMAADAALGNFLDELQRQGRLDAALILITSDHGESFEKGFLGHAGPLTHDALIRVPMVIKLPGQKHGQVLQMPASQADLAPTLLDLVDAPPLPRSEGRSLRAALEGLQMQASPVFAMTMERQSRFQPLREGHYVVIDGDHKLTLRLGQSAGTSATPTLTDLAADPEEAQDLTATRPQRTRELEALLRQRLAAAERARLQVPQPGR